MARGISSSHLPHWICLMLWTVVCRAGGGVGSAPFRL